MLHQCVCKSRGYHNHANNIPQTPENQCSFILYVCSKHNYYAYHLVMSCKWLYKTFLWYKNYSAAQSRVTRQELHTICEHLLFFMCLVLQILLSFLFFGMFVFFLCLVPNFASLPGFITNLCQPTDFSHVDIIIYIILLEPQQLHTYILHTVTTNYINVLHCFMTIIVNYEISCMNFQYRKQTKLSVLQVLSRYRKKTQNPPILHILQFLTCC